MAQPEKDSFSYFYSAKEQEEIKEIRAKYVPKEEDKLERLRRLDAGVTRKGTIAALTLGIAATLVFGFGMCCVLVWADRWFIPGVVIGILGIVGAVLAYPLYVHITKKERARVSGEILRLTQELLK